MQNLDSLTLKFFFEENAAFLNGAVVQKIQMPKRTEIILYLRNNGENKKLYININPKYPHICFIENKMDIPKNPPMFCMHLRKYIEGQKIIKAEIIPYERVLEFHFSNFDEFGILHSLILSIELMGKYSNVILRSGKTGLITGCAHNVSPDKSSVREIYGGIKYIYPPKQNKKDILKAAQLFDEDISENFYYFSKPFAIFLKNRANNKNELLNLLQNAVINPSLIKEFWGGGKNFNSIIYNYYSKIVNSDLIQAKKTALIKILENKTKRVQKILDEKINTEKRELYKKSGDLIFQYIYLIKKGDKNAILEGVEIKLDENLTPAQNAQKYYKLYSKLKTSYEILNRRKEAARNEKNYFDGVIFSVQNAQSLIELEEIEEEICPKEIKKSQKPVFTPENYGGFEIYTGKNNKQNDYLIKKIAAPEDIWLHVKDGPSSHVIIKTQNGKTPVTDEVLLYAAVLVKNNSPFKNAIKAPVIFTKRKFIRRPPDTPLGYVTYREEKEIMV